ncbi:hypothetical protein RHSIM_Rhsim06G0132000 [Rhododendron simsii]|uniref:Uncharacterized protein n=1 Tax=Rhododendron simsii TaxID=118357 RepID=A0A834LN24_RHOSS|nr:hypothetical protein RHSIM_Rhsim06G0132000 [Rhododendron simsii]
MKIPSRYKTQTSRRTQSRPSSIFSNIVGTQLIMHSPILSESGLYRNTLRREKSNKSYVVEETGGEEGDETDMVKFRLTPRDVENEARLKQRKVALDDAIVEDTPPLKIVQRSSKGTRTQENLGVERFFK